MNGLNGSKMLKIKHSDNNIIELSSDDSDIKK